MGGQTRGLCIDIQYLPTLQATMEMTLVPGVRRQRRRWLVDHVLGFVALVCEMRIIPTKVR